MSDEKKPYGMVDGLEQMEGFTVESLQGKDLVKTGGDAIKFIIGAAQNIEHDHERCKSGGGCNLNKEVAFSAIGAIAGGLYVLMSMGCPKPNITDIVKGLIAETWKLGES